MWRSGLPAHLTHWLMISASFFWQVSLPRRVSNTCSISREGRRVGGRVHGFPIPSTTSSLHMYKKESSIESQLGLAYSALQNLFWRNITRKFLPFSQWEESQEQGMRQTSPRSSHVPWSCPIVWEQISIRVYSAFPMGILWDSITQSSILSTICHGSSNNKYPHIHHTTCDADIFSPSASLSQTKPPDFYQWTIYCPQCPARLIAIDHLCEKIVPEAVVLNSLSDPFRFACLKHTQHSSN